VLAQLWLRCVCVLSPSICVELTVSYIPIERELSTALKCDADGVKPTGMRRDFISLTHVRRCQSFARVCVALKDMSLRNKLND
jgi:hypothetical protein